PSPRQAEDLRVAGVRQQQRRQQPDQCRLARAVLAQNRDALAALHGEGHALERRYALTPLAHVRPRRVAAEEFLAQVVDLYCEHFELLRFGGTRIRATRLLSAGGAWDVRSQPKKSVMPSRR